MRRQRTLLPYTSRAVSILLLAGLAALSPGVRAATASAVDLDGRRVDPLKADAGKVVVLIFVRTDCPISNRYAPTIQRISAHYADKAAFWLVYPDKAESPAEIRKHDEDFGYKIPALRDLDHALVKAAQVKITPEVAVFDASGQLVYHGRIDDWYVDFGKSRTQATTHELNDALDAALAGHAPAVRVTEAVGCYIADIE